MFFYPGGTYSDPTTVGYDFFMNYFSNLGMTVSLNGAPNTISRVLFTLSVVIAGVSLFPFLIAIPKYVADNLSKKIVARITSGFGFIVAIAYIAIGLLPVDLYPGGHIFSVVIAFMGTFPVIFIYTLLTYSKKDIPRIAPYTFMVFCVISFSYILLLLFGPRISTPEGLMINVVGQKIIVYTEMISMVIAGYFMAQYANKIG